MNYIILLITFQRNESVHRGEYYFSSDDVLGALIADVLLSNHDRLSDEPLVSLHKHKIDRNKQKLHRPTPEFV